MKAKLKPIITDLLMIKAQHNRARKHENKVGHRRKFIDLFCSHADDLALEIEKITDERKNAFCIMSPVGGPWYIRPESFIHIYNNRLTGFDLVFDSYIGKLDLLDDPCGVDNLKILANYDLKGN